MKQILQIFIILIFSCCSNNNNGKNMDIKYFENIDFKKLNDKYISKSIKLNNESVDIDLNFDNKNPNENQILILKSYFENLDKIIEQNSKKIKSEFESNEVNDVKEYIYHHLQEIPKDELSKIIDLDNKNKTDKLKLLEKLQLKRIGFFPQENSYYAIFDYTIGYNFTQYLISITTDKEGKIIDVKMES